MQKEKIDVPFFRFWQAIIYRLKIHKSMQWSAKGIEKLFNKNDFLLKKIISYVFS